MIFNLASEGLGTRVLSVNDEFFAPKENLIRDKAPVFIEDKYTKVGKWMDGWETRRKRSLEPDAHDWCVLKLGARGIVDSIDVDTAFFTGNFPEAAMIEGADSNSNELKKMNWTTLISKSLLKGGGQNLFKVKYPEPFTHVRLKIYPDGGVARLRVRGTAVPQNLKGLVDVAAVKNGGFSVCSSDMYFSHQQNLLMPGFSKFMGGGWETKRRRGPGYDWNVIRLARPVEIKRIEIDTDHYKGNFPESASVEGALCDTEIEAAMIHTVQWRTILAMVKLKPDFRHRFNMQINRRIKWEGKQEGKHVNIIRLNIFPDGGIARLRVYGHVSH